MPPLQAPVRSSGLAVGVSALLARPVKASVPATAPPIAIATPSRKSRRVIFRPIPNSRSRSFVIPRRSELAASTSNSVRGPLSSLPSPSRPVDPQLPSVKRRSQQINQQPNRRLCRPPARVPIWIHLHHIKSHQL